MSRRLADSHRELSCHRPAAPCSPRKSPSARRLCLAASGAAVVDPQRVGHMHHSSHSAESDESSAGFQPATVGDTMQPVLDTDAMHDLRQFQIVFAQVVPVANSCPLEMTTWDAVKAHAGPVMLGELHRYPGYLGWGTTHGPAEGFGELPPFSLAGNERATPRSSSVSPLADGIESAAGSVTSFACDALVATTLPAAAATIHPTPDLTGGLHQTGHVPPLPLPLPALSIESAIAKAAGGGQMAGIPMQRSSVSDCFDCEVDDFELDSVSATRTVSDSSVTQAAAVPPKEKMARPHNQDVDGMLWDGAEAAGWKRHPTKHGAWVGQVPRKRVGCAAENVRHARRGEGDLQTFVGGTGWAQCAVQGTQTTGGEARSWA